MTRIVCISDTHGDHDKIPHMPEGDILIHSGDCTNDIGQRDLREFLHWFVAQPHKHKVFIAGNHDGAFQKWPDKAREMVAREASGVIYLEDSGVTIEGISIWGTPYTPEFYDWFFMAKRGDDIQTHWDKIPADTDVLITHGPAHGILDNNDRMVKCGCSNLLNTIQYKLPNLKLHVFGHIHHPGGYSQKVGNCTHINASILDEGYQVAHKPQIFYLE